MKFFVRYGLLGVLCYIVWWLALLYLVLYVLAEFWPITLTVLVLVVVVLIWRKRRKRTRR